MDIQDKKAITYVMIAIIFMASILFFMTLVHELGHAVAYILFGGQVIEIVVTPFDGGIVRGVLVLDGHYNQGIADAIIMLSGGLAVSLLFVLLGFFKRPLLIIAPLHIIDGIAEVFQMGGLHSSMTRLTVLFIVIVINHALYIRLRGNYNGTSICR